MHAGEQWRGVELAARRDRFDCSACSAGCVSGHLECDGWRGVMMVIAMNPPVMGQLTLPRPMIIGGWLATFVMALVAVGFFVI